MRGRSRSKGPNPLTRSYESNGPDVKVRGTAQHIAEKYGQLARDAQASGDPVAAENYFQHAEHYLRIIAGAQENLRQQYGAGRSDDDDDDDDDSNGYTHGYAQPDRGGQTQRVQPEEVDPGQQPQPPSFDPRAERQPDRGFQPRGRGDRRERFGRNQYDNRGNGDTEADSRDEAGQARAAQEAPVAGEDTGERPVRGRRRPAPRRSDEVEQPALPDFLMKPVSRPTETEAEAVHDDDAGDEKPKRRRAATATRRPTRKAATEGGESGEGAPVKKPAAAARKSPRKAASADAGANDGGSDDGASDKTAAE